MREGIIRLARRFLSRAARDRIVKMQRRYRLQWPRVGTVEFGSFRRLTPISPVFALDRGLPIERYYIEQFLAQNAEDVRGHALEMGDDTYVRRFGGNRVVRTDVLSVVEGPGVTIVADLTNADQLPSGTFDCIIFTQTLQMIYDMRSALRTLYRILAPGGVLLLTSHGISKVGRRLGRDAWGEYWRITSQGAERLMEETFPEADWQVSSYGNVLTAVCALHGLAAEELTPEELGRVDPDFDVIVAVRAVKSRVSSGGDSVS